jgi:hypothetical protein
MSSIVSVPRLNVLTFRPFAETGMQTFHNRLDYREEYPNHSSIPLWQIFDDSDYILIQITTNNTIKNCKLINVETDEITDLTAEVASYSSAWLPVQNWTNTEYGSFGAFDKHIYTSLLNGFYQIKLEFDAEADYLISEVFEIGDFATYPLLEYYHSEIGLKKGIYFDGSQIFQFRLNAKFAKYKPGAQLETNESFNYILDNIEGDVLFYGVLEFDGIPRYLVEKVFVTLQVDTKILNDVRFSVESGGEMEMVEGKPGQTTNIYTGTMTLRQYEYENYEDFESEEEVETFYRIVNGDEDRRIVSAENYRIVN